MSPAHWPSGSVRRRERDVSLLTAAILAGGLGTRLRAVVADRPKVLAPVAGRPFLARLLDQVADGGAGLVVLCTGHLGEQVEAAFGRQWGRLALRYSREAVPLGTGGALRAALPLLEGSPVLVLNGDSYCGVDIRALKAFHAAGPGGVSIVLTEVPDMGRFGRVTTGESDTIVGFEEKTSVPIRGMINAGIYLMDRDVIDMIPVGAACSLEREVFPRLIGPRLRGFRTDGPFLDIGTPGSYAEAERFFA